MPEQRLEMSSTAMEVEKFYGKYPGRVIDNAPSGDAAHRGGLLVEVPGLLEETPDGAGQRSMQVLAMPCFAPGFFFIPENEARVWIEFAAGDINTPLWTGVWYPMEKPPKTFDDQPPTLAQKIIRTASGHVIQIDDTEGEEKIIIRQKNNSLISIDNENLNIAHSSETSVNIDTDGNVAIRHKDGRTIFEIKENEVDICAQNINFDGAVTIKGETTIEENTYIKKDLEVGDSGPKTTISGNKITGG